MVFSGIVECKGDILSVAPIRGSDKAVGITLVIKPHIGTFMNEDISIGCSIAVNGVCLTVTKFNNQVGKAMRTS